ncbi:hypothetical protein [Rhizobium sp. TRM95796]|uniref:hypothetical protein n=1 Tax=Rhizobium sp. TRM95796 TaxID=2979862 RepID=UPI0021E8C416|nr:hypothetical protein [Rhizobium sp. TRM95796]MCV3764794.1 hypothetical protein [Rhizobium sp. TRM95796]
MKTLLLGRPLRLKSAPPRRELAGRRLKAGSRPVFSPDDASLVIDVPELTTRNRIGLTRFVEQRQSPGKWRLFEKQGEGRKSTIPPATRNARVLQMHEKGRAGFDAPL